MHKGNEATSYNRSIVDWSSVIAVLFFITGSGAVDAAAAPCTDDLPPVEVIDQQKALVEAFSKHLRGVKEEEKVGQRQIWEILRAQESYYEAVEVLGALETCKTGDTKAVLASRMKTASERADLFRDFANFAKQRWEVGEITQTDVAWAEAYALRAEIRLKTLESRSKRK